MGRIKILIALCMISSYLNAANVIDVYGTGPKEADDLMKNYGFQVEDIQSQFEEEMIKISNGGKDQHLMNVIFPKKNQLINKIKTQYNFSYVEFETIFYPNQKDTHTTIEVIRQNDKSRLRFIPKKIKIPPAKQSKHDLVDKMIAFQDTSMNLLLNNKLKNNQTKCPVYHCLPGFNHPKLRDSFKLFTQQAGKEKELLINTINKDPLPERRTAAIYLIGYLNDPHEIISLLTNHAMNTDDGVRNSAMRVISETMDKSKIHEINLIPFMELLDSPFDTDRNKALLVLLNGANLTTSKQLIIQQADKRLVSLLRLKQPNNHKVAYALLKKISNQDFGSHNAQAWEKWFTRIKKTTV